MPAASTIQRGNLLFDTLVGAVVTPPNALAAASTTTTTLTVNGLVVGDFIGDVNFQAALPNNIILVNAFCGSANTLSLQWTNPSAGVSGASSPLNTVINVCRFENWVVSGFSSVPTAVL